MFPFRFDVVSARERFPIPSFIVPPNNRFFAKKRKRIFNPRRSNSFTFPAKSKEVAQQHCALFDSYFQSIHPSVKKHHVLPPNLKEQSTTKLFDRFRRGKFLVSCNRRHGSCITSNFLYIFPHSFPHSFRLLAVNKNPHSDTQLIQFADFHREHRQMLSAKKLCH